MSCCEGTGPIHFEDELVRNGACLHQGPVRKKTGAHGNPEASDAYILSFSNNYYPSTPVLVSDMKLNDIEHALKETGLYAQAGTDIWHDTENCPLILGLPMTPNCAALYIHVVAAEEMWAVPVIDHIGKILPFNPALLCTVYAAVQHLCLNPISTNDPLHILCLTLLWTVTLPWVILGTPRPFISNLMKVEHKCIRFLTKMTFVSLQTLI